MNSREEVDDDSLFLKIQLSISNSCFLLNLRSTQLAQLRALRRSIGACAFLAYRAKYNVTFSRCKNLILRKIEHENMES